MMKRLMAALTLSVVLVNASAMDISAKVICTGSEQQIATLKIKGNVNPEHVGLPGLLYVGLASISNNTLYKAYGLQDGQFVNWSGGMMPIAQIVRGGLGGFSFQVDVTQFLFDPSLAVYVGYGVLTPKMEDTVQKMHMALQKAREIKPEANIQDVGDDWRRSSLIEDDMRKQGRYQKVLQSLACA